MHRAYSLDWSPSSLSPTTQKNILNKKVKQVTKLKEELQNEISEKNDLLEENTSLKKTVENLNQKLKLKTQENEKLKDDLQDLQMTYEKTSEEMTSRCSSENEIVLNNLKSEIEEYRKYIYDLEMENESSKRALQKCEQRCSKITDEYVIMENHFEELKSSFTLNLEKIEQLQQTCNFMRIELSDLKECNQVLKEENVKLEAKKSSFNENSECLERELQFQFMKDEIERMTSNLETIENEQTKLISANVDLTREKAETLQKLQLLLKENEEVKLRNEELESKISSLDIENKSLKNFADNLDTKLKDVEKLFRDREQRLEFLTKEYEFLKEKLHVENKELQQKYDELTENNRQLILQLETVINEKENYRTVIQENKTKLEAKETEYETLTNKHSRLTIDHDHLANLLRKTESELNSLQLSSATIEKELDSKINLIETLQANKATLTTRCDKLICENVEISQSLMNTNNELIAVKTEKEDLTVMLKETNAEKEKILQDNHSLMQCNRSLNEQIGIEINLNNELKIQLESKISELKNISVERNTLLNEYDDLKKTDLKLIETLRDENEDIKSNNSELLETNQKQSSIIQNLQSQIQDLLCVKDSISKELQASEIKYINLMKDFHEKLDAASHKQEALVTINDVLQNENTNLLSRFCEVSREKESYHEQIKISKQKIDELVLSKNSLSDELTKAELKHSESTSKLQDQLKSLLLELKELTTKNQLLDETNSTFHDKVSSMAEQEDILQQKLKTHAEQILILQQELNNALNERDLLSASSSRLTAENSELHNCIADFSKKNEFLEQRLGESKKMNKTLSENNEELLKKIQEQEMQITDVSNTNLSLTKKLEENEVGFNEKFEELQQKLNCTLQEYDEKLQSNERLNNENIILITRTDEIMKENQSLHEQLKRFKEHQSLLSQTNLEHLQKIQTLENEICNLMKSRDNLSENLRQAETNFEEKIYSVQEELNAALLDCKSQSEKRAYLAEEIIILQTRISDLSLNEQSLQQQLEELKKEKADAANCRNVYEEKIQKQKNEIEDLVISKNFLSQEILKNETINAEKIQKLNQQLDILLCEKELWEKNNIDLVQKNTALHSKIVELLKEDQELKLQLEKYKEENIISLQNDAKHLSTIHDLESQVENLLSTNDSLSEELQIKKLSYDNRCGKLEKELYSVSQERDCLNKKNCQLAEEISVLKTRSSLMQKENLDVQQQLREFHKDKTNSFTELREMFLHQIDQLQKANEEIREENHQLVEKNAEKLLCLKEVERRFEILTQDMKELKIKTDELEMINGKLQHKVEECKESETNLLNENASLKELINNSETEKESLLKQIDALSNNEKMLNENLQDVLKEIEEAKLDHKELKKVIAVEYETNENLKKMNSELLEKIDHLELEKEKFQSEISKLSNHVTHITQERKSEFQKLQQENVKLKTRLDELTSQKEELYKMEKINKDVFENQLQSFTTRNQCLQNEVEKLHNLIENMDTNMITLKEKIQHSESIIDELRSSNEKEKAEITAALESEKQRSSEISTRLESFKKENENICKQLESEKERTRNLIQTYEMQLLKEQEVKKSLECKLKNVESSEMQSLRKRIEELKTKLEEVVESNECLSENSKLKTNQHEFLLKENENLMRKINLLEKHVEKEYDQILEEKEENRKLNDDMRIQLKNLNKLLEGKDRDIVRLKEEYDVFKEEYRKLVQHKGELDKEFQETLLQENTKLSKKCDELTDANIKFMEQLSEKTKAIESLQAEFDRMDHCISNTDDKINLNETRVISSEPDNDIYLNLRHENIKLMEERDNFKNQLANMALQLEKEKEAYRSKAQNLYSKISTKMVSEYEGKLERAKAEYQKIIKQKYCMQESDWKKREEEYKLMLKKEKEHIRDLSSQMWDISDKYLQLKQKLETKSSPLKFRTHSEETLFSPSTLSRRTKSATQLNLLGSKGYRVADFDRRLSTMSEDLPPQIRRRQTLTISAKVFPTEDEEQEIFDNACLADLKQGRISIDDSNDFSKQRLSILQQRNSLCPPHLKSSYPAETQFIPPQEFRENDIKMGLAGENDNSDIENLIPRESRESLRKSRNQTSYKKPGPPTPSKNGGRTTQPEHHETPRNILKESNDNGNGRRKSFTPKFFNNLFALRGHATVTIPQDENVSTTPRQNRLSSIRRRFGRNPQELGNTNSGFC